MTERIVEVDKLRCVLYDLLTGSVENDDAPNVTQNMGIALTNAMRKDGVNIVAVQSVNIRKIALKVTEALRVLDHARPVEVVEAQVVEDHDSLPAIIEANLNEGVTLDDFLDFVATAYVSAAMERERTKKAVTEKLAITYSRLQKTMGKD